MLNRLLGRKPKPDEKQEENVIRAPARLMVTQESSIDLQITAVAEPDYSKVPHLHLRSGQDELILSNVMIIGLGHFGEAVLQELARYVPARDEKRSLNLLSIRLSEETSPDFELPDNPGLLLATEMLELDVARSTRNYSWYDPVSNVLVRADGRLALFQSLTKRPPLLWDILQKHIQGTKPDIWIISAAFEPASGMILDLARLVHQISEEQRGFPFVGCLLALPNNNWAFNHLGEASATIREIERLLRRHTNRHYDAYNPEGDNPDLRKTEGRGDDDISSIILCEPDPEHYGQDAARKLVHKIALGLYSLMQTSIWNTGVNARKFLQEGKHPEHSGENFCCSTFGVTAHRVPIEALRYIVCSWLTWDVLLERSQGILQIWNEEQVVSLAPDEDELHSFLLQCEHPLLNTLGSIRSQMDIPFSWPSDSQSDLVLADKLFKRFQSYGKEIDGLLHCTAFVIALGNLFVQLDLPDQTARLMPVINSTIEQTSEWLAWARDLRSIFQHKIDQAETTWRSVFEQPLDQNIIDEQSAEIVYQSFKDENSTLIKKLQEFVRPGWKRQNNQLHLVLDVFVPGWQDSHKPNKFQPQKAKPEQIWDAVFSVVSALTQNDADWQQLSLAGSIGRLPEVHETVERASVSLKYDPGLFPPGLAQATMAIQASKDQLWRSRIWLPKADQANSIICFTPYLGVILKIHQAIPLGSSFLYCKLQERYQAIRTPPSALHVFFAEQHALELERSAIEGIGVRERREMPYKHISHASVDLLDNYAEVLFFVKLWGNGYVKATKKRNGMMITELKSNTPFWETEYNANPLAVLKFFLQESPKNVYQALHEEITSKPVADTQHLQMISDWWKKDQAHYDWYVFVQGLKGIG